MKLLRHAPHAALVGLALAANSAQATFHQWDINEVLTSSDGTVQFIELQTPTVLASGENSLAGHTLTATSTVGGMVMPTVTFTFPSPNPVGDTTDKHLLVATPTFQDQTGSVIPDYNTLPTGFFDPNADSIQLNFAEGLEIETILGNVLPKDGLHSVSDANLFGASNFVSGINSPTNFAGQSGSINVPPPPLTTGDYNGNGTVDAADYTVWRDTFGQTADNPGDGADGNSSGSIDSGDYQYWKDRFGNTVPMGAGSLATVVPEPPAGVMILAGLLMLAWTRTTKSSSNRSAGHRVKRPRAQCAGRRGSVGIL